MSRSFAAVLPCTVVALALAGALLAGCATTHGPHGGSGSAYEARTVERSPHHARTSVAAVVGAEDPPAVVPAHAYAAMAPAACAKALYERGVSFTYVDVARGVNAPIRLTGPLHGVDFHSEPTSHRATSAYEILDCRLALAIDDFAKILAQHDIVEVVHMSMYRPPPAHITDPTKRRSKHEAALAIDVGTLKRRDGTSLVIQHDWHGRIGARTCGSGAGPEEITANAVELRSILCETAEAQLFHVVLTPNNDSKHFNHFHLEVVRDVKWFIVK